MRLYKHETWTDKDGVIHLAKYYIVESNVFNIPERIKEIDPDYFILFNTYSQKYELHHTLTPWNTYQLTFPYEALDERAVFHVNRTHVRRAKQLAMEVEEHNRKLDEDKKKRFSDQVREISNWAYDHYHIEKRYFHG
jgi:hypothetical protein